MFKYLVIIALIVWGCVLLSNGGENAPEGAGDQLNQASDETSGTAHHWADEAQQYVADKVTAVRDSVNNAVAGFKDSMQDKGRDIGSSLRHIMHKQ